MRASTEIPKLIQKELRILCASFRNGFPTQTLRNLLSISQKTKENQIQTTLFCLCFQVKLLKPRKTFKNIDFRWFRFLNFQLRDELVKNIFIRPHSNPLRIDYTDHNRTNSILTLKAAAVNKDQHVECQIRLFLKIFASVLIITSSASAW